MTKPIISVLLIVLAISIKAQKESTANFDVGINLLVNNSYNPVLVNGPTKRTFGGEILASKYFSKKLGLTSGIIVLEKSFGTSPGFGIQHFVYTGLPLFINYNVANMKRFNIKAKGGPILEYLAYKEHPEWFTSPNSLNLSFRAEIGFEYALINNIFALVNANLTQSINQDQMGGFRNYGIGIGILKKFHRKEKASTNEEY